MSLLYLLLNKAVQNVGHPFWQRRSIVTPAPDRHFRTTERPSRGSVTTEHYLEQKIVPPAGKPTLETR
jgi:hypothetical protein